ncbi:MAG: hypothetical protein A3K13_02805 [Gemmatimonadetes bacterium RIFCSPLOWO2_12_FULL_68_9]|nr:MAG: hypothetical protein A3K13_02805 [Gemmatimonadetes bacterium RIFCSPLOWO2_12_FULL_68_9]
MARRTIEADGERWEIYPSGRVTVYHRDEFGLVFEKGEGPERVRRVTRYAPLGARRWDVALAELSERELAALFRQSQPAWTSPETRYDRRAG